MSGPSLAKKLLAVADVLILRPDERDTVYEAANLEAERDALQKKHQQLLGIINDKHEVDPEHDSEPPIFHKGWELCTRSIIKLYKEAQ